MADKILNWTKYDFEAVIEPEQIPQMLADIGDRDPL
jgi:hypothetical protein